MIRTASALLVTALALSACIPQPPVAPPVATPQDSCGAAGFQGLLGQSGQIARLLVLDRPIRVIAPGSAVTMDYSPDRINFDLDAADRIAGIRCG